MKLEEAKKLLEDWNTAQEVLPADFGMMMKKGGVQNLIEAAKIVVREEQMKSDAEIVQLCLDIVGGLEDMSERLQKAILANNPNNKT